MTLSRLKTFKYRKEDAFSDSEVTINTLDKSFSLTSEFNDMIDGSVDIELKPSHDTKLYKIQNLRLKFPDVSPTEEIINDFSCALKKDILLHGRLFIGLENIYFISNILKYETKIIEKWSNIVSIEKAKLANIIPNCIKITTNDAKLTFSSFVSRTYPLELLLYAFKNYNEQMGLKGQEIRNHIKKSLEKISKKNKTGRNSTNENLPTINIEGVDEELYDNFNDSDLQICGSSLPNLNHKNLSFKAATCSCQKLKYTILKKIFNVNIDDIFNSLYDDASVVIKNVYEKCNFQEYKMISSETQDDNTIVKIMTNVFPNAFMGKSAKNTIRQTFSSANTIGKHYQITSLSTSEGVPFSDTFEVLTRTCLLRMEENRTSIKAYFEVNFKKQGWTIPKDTIEKTSLKTSNLIHDEIVKQLSVLYGPPSDIMDKISEDKEETKETAGEIKESVSIGIEAKKSIFSVKNILFVLVVALLFYSIIKNFQQGKKISYLEKELGQCKS